MKAADELFNDRHFRIKLSFSAIASGGGKTFLKHAWVLTVYGFERIRQLYHCINGGYVFKGCRIQKRVRTRHWWTRDISINLYIFKYCIHLPSLPSAFSGLIILPGRNACTMVSKISMKYWHIKASAQGSQRIAATSHLFLAESNFHQAHI